MGYDIIILYFLQSYDLKRNYNVENIRMNKTYNVRYFKMMSANDHSTETSIFVFENHLERREKINAGIFVMVVIIKNVKLKY